MNLTRCLSPPVNPAVGGQPSLYSVCQIRMVRFTPFRNDAQPLRRQSYEGQGADTHLGSLPPWGLRALADLCLT